MLLLVAAIGYGIRLERKLTPLRAGQLAFAGAVTELNTAAGRAENALASLRMSGEEADMLHDRIIKAREVKTELEALIARAHGHLSLPFMGRDRTRKRARRCGEVRPPATAAVCRLPRRRDGPCAWPSLAERIQGWRRRRARPAAGDRTPVLAALTANQAAQQSLNRARRSLDEDLFAA